MSLQFEPKKPISGNWDLLPDPPDVVAMLQGYRYLSPLGACVISSVHIVENANGEGVSPHFHISISDNGERASSEIAQHVLRCFGAEDFEEDNHAPRKVIRSFWRPIKGPPTECPCKDDVPPEIDGDYVWREK